MSEARLSKLEESFNSMQVSFGRMEATLESIDKNLKSAIDIKETVITQTEKLKVTENRLLNLETEQKEIGRSIASINLKIALVTGAWGVIFFLIQHFLSR